MSAGPLVPVPAATKSGRLRGIEGLRAVAATAVVVQHVWILDGGARVGVGSRAETVLLNLSLGVTLFFALSGFLLYRPFAAAIARQEALPSVRSYLRNRGLRILPAYWVILILTAFVLQTAGTRPGGGPIEFGLMSDPLELAKAMLLIQDYFPNSVVVGIGPAWSLAVEVVFYLLLPVLVLVVARYARPGPRGRRIALLAAPPLLLLAIGLSGKFVAGIVIPATPAEGYTTDWHSVVERSFWAQADLFSFGMLAAVLHTEVADGRVRLPRGWRTAALAVGAGVFAVCATSLESGQLSYLPQNTAVGFSAALLLAVVAFPAEGDRSPLLQRVFEWRFIVSVGLVSYSVFLWNEPVVRWLAARGVTEEGWAGFAWNLGLTVAIVAILSIITYRLVELPALQRKRRVEPMDAAQLEAAP